jgi:hypothetical protein
MLGIQTLELASQSPLDLSTAVKEKVYNRMTNADDDRGTDAG